MPGNGETDHDSMDSWGFVTKSNISEMIDRTNRYKEPLLKMAILIKDLVSEYNAKQSNKAQVFISDGTLLGAYRNGKMISHDYDFDYGMYGTVEELGDLCKYLFEKVSDYNLKNNKSYILKLSNTYAEKIAVFDPDYGTCESETVQLYDGKSVEWYNVQIDIQLLSDRLGKENEIEYRYFRDGFNEKNTQTRDVILPLSEIEFEGYVFNAPNDVEQFLINNYGCIEKGAVFNHTIGKYEMPDKQ